MSDHVHDLAAAYGLRGATPRDIPFMIEAAWDTDEGMVIAARIIDVLRQANPAISTIERAGIAGRAQARKQAAHALVAGLRPVQLDALDALMILEAGRGTIPLTWLKPIPTAAKPDYVRDILERLRMVR